MTDTGTTRRTRKRGLRIAVVVALLTALVGIFVCSGPGRSSQKFVGLFSSAVGLYPGDSVRVVGVPVGTVASIEPRDHDVKVTMSVRNDVKVPLDARAIIVSPNLLAERFIHDPPCDTKCAGRGGPVLADGATIGLDRTGVPGRVGRGHRELAKLSKTLGPRRGRAAGSVDPVRGPGGGHVRRQR